MMMVQCQVEDDNNESTINQEQQQQQMMTKRKADTANAKHNYCLCQ